MAAPLVGIKKSLPTTLPLLALAPVTADELVLLKLASFHVPLCQLLPVCVWVPLKLVWLLALLTAMLALRVDVAVAILKPESPFFQAVLRVKTKLPGWLLSVKPLAALEKAMQLVITWLAGPLSAASPPPSLNPFPSPWKSENPQLLNVRMNS